jgi:hypothetical protein
VTTHYYANTATAVRIMHLDDDGKPTGDSQVFTGRLAVEFWRGPEAADLYPPPAPVWDSWAGEQPRPYHWPHTVTRGDVARLRAAGVGSPLTLSSLDAAAVAALAETTGIPVARLRPEDTPDAP